MSDALSARIASLTPEQRELFEKLQQKRQRKARLLTPPPVPPASGASGAGDWPLSLDQERFWFMEQLYADQAGLNITAASRMRGPLAVPFVAAALAEIGRRHAAWRTTFPVTDGRAVQRVAAPDEAPPQRLALVDLTGIPAERREGEMARAVAIDTAAPFDLARGPLLRSTLVRLAAEDHACVLTIHHLVTDWIAFQIAWAELAVIYDALAAGRPPVLPPPPTQYPDFATWQRQWLQGEVLAELVSWWRERLAGVPPTLELPTDRPRPAVAQLRGGRVAFNVPAELTEGLRAAGRAEGATIFMTVLAGIAALLARDSGQETLILGANNANRNRPEIAPVLGCFLTQVPFVIELAGDPTYRELLGRVRRSALGAFTHQDLPFGKLVEAIDLERDPSRQPLIQNLVQVLDGQYSKTRLAGIEFEPIDSWDGRARYDLMLSLFDYPTGLTGALEYDADLFDETTTLRRVERFLLQAAAAVADPEIRLAALPVLSAAARQQATVEWNDAARPLPTWTVPARVAAQAAATPEAPAIVAGGETLSYRELASRADGIARALRELGVGVGSRVALLLGRNADVPAAILGVWGAGGAYVPLDAGSPPERLSDLLADAAPAVVVHRGPLPLPLAEGVCELDLADLAAGPALDPPAPLATPAAADLAYMIYTSGTTGRPKAVMVEHGSLAVVLADFVERFAIGPGDRMPHLARYTFDASFLDLMAPLLAGGTSEIVAADDVLDPERVLDALERSTLLFSVPALLRRLTAGARRRGPSRFARLRAIGAGADVVSPDLQTDLLAAFPAAALHVLYGPTEATIICVAYAVPRSDRPQQTLIGHGMASTEMRVVDAHGEEAALGVPGELWIGGAVVARGYFRRDELTAERFVTAGGRRFYRSGDLVRRVPAAGGALEFLGRIDLQIKVRGFRIEPGEIEAALADHPAVREAVVVAAAGAGEESRLVAYVALTGGGGGEAAAIEEIRAHLRARLPEYMVPAVFVPLAALPLNSSGKVDRKALPAPAPAREAAGAAPPRDAKEALLAEIWAAVLGLERVGIHDNFFQLGGDSILSIQVVARARRAGLLLTPRQLFDNQTIAGLAAVADRVDAGGTAAAAAAAEQGAIVGEVPLTPIQRRFFAEPRREPQRFNQAVLLAPRQRLAAAPLAAALARIAFHHDALRLRFAPPAAGETAWRQWMAPPAGDGGLAQIDLTALPSARRTPALEAAAEHLQAGLDLAAGPLFTAALFRLTPQAAAGADRLLLTAHHLAVDGVSWRVVVEDLAAAYRQLAAGRSDRASDRPAARPGDRPAAVELPAKTTSWKRWAERLIAYAASPELAAELAHWSALPRSVPPLPVDRTDGGAAPGIAAVSSELDGAATRALLTEVPAVYRTQVNDILLAALARAFAGWSGEDTLLVDLEGHGREDLFADVDLSRTVGWFTTLFPVALALPAGGVSGRTAAGPSAAIRAVKEQLRAIPGRGLGYGLLRFLGEPAVRAALAALPAPAVSFNYLGQVDRTVAEGELFALAGETVRGTEGEAIEQPHAFSIDALVLNDRLRITWTYDPSRHLAATVERLAARFVDEIAALVAHCRMPEAGGFTPSDFPLAGLDQAALDRLLGNDRDVEDLYPLAPLQQGILFHSLYSTDSELYVEQMSADLLGPLDEAAFAAAWRRVVERHAALRTAFVWRDLVHPLQLVRRAAELSWTCEDWRALEAAAPGESAARWARLLSEDRRRGFDLDRPPLTRLTLVRVADGVHRLLWSFHHLIFDGWCFSLLLGDVFALYEAVRTGGEPRLPPAPRPYRDYIAWLAGRDAAEAETYWRQALRGFAAATPLPYDRERPPGSTGSLTDDYFEITALVPGERFAALEGLAQRLRVTLNTLVQGAWAILLARSAQAAEVVFGAVVSGRPAELPGVESMVGLFINTLPVRVAVPPLAVGGDTSAVWLAGLQASQFALRQHEWTPLARVQALAEVPAGEPLFASLLAFENYPVDREIVESLGELEIGELVIGERTNYPLTLTAVARGELALRLTADRRFEPATARRLLSHLENLLAALAADAERPPRGLPLLGAGERHQLAVEWNDTATAFPGARSIPELFAEQAARRPQAVALLSGEGRLTYRELDERSDALAGELARRGVRRGDLVGLFAERSPLLVTAILAVLKAGAAYAPLDPAYPRQRLALMLGDLGAATVLVQPELAARLPIEPARALALTPEVFAPGAKGSAPAAATRAGGGDLAYVIYTSGSTGTPKGVAVSHSSVVRLVRETGYATFGEDETFLMMAPVSFDASTLEIWGPLLNGGRLAILPPGEVTLDGLESAIRSFGVTALWLTAGLFHLVVDERPAALAPLRQLLAGGDVLSPPHVARLRRALPHLALVNGYGPTENTTFTATQRIGDEGDREDGAIPLGRPIANSRVLVLGGDLEPSPIGVPGELYAGGAGLAVGYLGRPELTAAAFVPSPLGDLPGERLYRTGDLVRRLPDGRLDFLGRIDDQVKVRGFRIEPGEIEAVLAGHPDLRAAAVVAVRGQLPGGGGDRRLAAFAVARGTRPSADAVLAWLGERLPAHMVPAELAWLDALPLAPTGKVDRAALLRAAERSAAEEKEQAAAGDGAPPATAAEAALLAVWRQVLGRERIGLEDSFFRLGGDSILSIQVVARARQAGWVVTPRQLFEEQTIAALAAVAMPLAAVESEQGAVEGAVPLTPIQRYFLDAAPVDPHHFNQALLLAPRAPEPEPLDLAALATALAALVAHHDALRLRFAATDGIWRAWNAPLATIDHPGDRSPLAAVDLAALPPPRRAAALEDAAAALQGGFDLARGPLFRAAWFGLGAGEGGRLLLVAHHLVVDGVSWRILLEDLETAYAQAGAGAAVALPAKTTSWKRWAEQLAAHARAPESRRELPLWLATAARSGDVAPLPARSAGAPDDPLAPADGSRLADLGSAAVSLGRPATAALLAEAPAAYRTQVNDLLLAALALAFSRWTAAASGETRLHLDLEGHGREEVEPGLDLSRTTGWFTTIFPVVLAARAGDPPGDVIRATKEALRAVPRHGIGYGLLRYLGGGEDAAPLAAAPAAEIAFNYLGQLDGALGSGSRWTLAPESAGPEQSRRARPRHSIEVNAWVLGGELRVGFTYDAGRHAAADMERLASWYAEALERLVAHCTAAGAAGATPSDFPLAGLAADTLDALVGVGRRFDRGIEDVYPLAPLQSGLLFQGLFAPGSGLYFEHLTAELDGALDAAAFAGAWQAVVERHPALRTSFAWEVAAADGQAAMAVSDDAAPRAAGRRLPRPLQVVRRHAVLPWAAEDWRQVPEDEVADRLAAWMAADRARPFDLARAPLMRGALLRTGERRHRFVWSFHHLLLDGWCFSLIFREVFAFYQAAVAGRAAALPPVRPYRDFIAWVERQDGATAAEWFRTMLAGFTAPTRLALDRQTPPGDGEVPRHQEVRLAPAVTAGLAALARSRELTLNSLVQGAWGLLLARHDGQPSGEGGARDVVFGTVVSGRPAELPGVESMVGLFINTLPARLRVDPAAPLAAWLAGVQALLLELRQRETVPLAEIQRLSEVPPGEALFQSFVAFENYPVDEALGEDAGELAVRDVTVSDRTEYPLSLAVLPGREAGRPELALRLAHDGRADATTVRRLLAHLELLLGAFAASSVSGAAAEIRLGDLPSLAAAERHQLVVEWGRGEEAAAAPPSIPLALAALAARRPQAPALVWRDERLSHGELDRRAEDLARRLRGAGLGGGDVVGLCVERSAAIAVGMLGIWKAGAAFVPLDPALPQERLAWLLADSGARAVVADERGLSRLPAFDGALLELAGEASGDASGAASEADGGPPAEAKASDLAYLIYTSGTTGQPKAVAVEHGNLARMLDGIRRELGWDDGRAAGEAGTERMPSLAPFSFDIFLFELLAPLLSGGACELLPIAPVPDPDDVLAAVSRATRFHAVPALMRQIVAAARRQASPALYAGLRAIYLGGDVVPPDLLAALREAFPAAAVRVLYGPTEGTILATTFPLADALPARAPLGRPLPGVEVRIDGGRGAADGDGDWTPCAIGVPGEIYLGGVGVARGYLGRGELTAERFIRRGGERWYRTGDLGRFLPDGNLEFLGRADAQLKIRGFRIEPGEIEAALAAHPEVAAAVVLPHDAGHGDRQLVAFVVARPAGEASAEVDGSALAAFLGGRLPDYMVPARFVPLAELPLTRHGKVDRRALAEMAARPSVGTLGGAAAVDAAGSPRTPAEALLAAIWAEVLRLDRVGIHDDFFRLGGDSILSIQVVARARQAGLALTPKQLFEHPTVASLAALAPSLAERVPDEQGAVVGEVPLSPIQRELLERPRPEPQRYNQSVLLAVRRPVAPAVLHGALAALAEHHDALRLRFALGAAGWRQWIAPPSAADLRWAWIDLAALPPARLPAAIAAATGDIQSSLDLERGPLFAAGLLATPAEDRLFLTAHHLAVDAISWPILLADLETGCTRREAGEAAVLPPKTTSWKRWAEGLAERAGSAELRAELPSWLAPEARIPHDLPPLPVDRQGGENLAGSEELLSSELSPALTTALLREAPAAYRTRLDELLLAGLALAFARWSGEPRLAIEVEGHGREEDLVVGADLSRTVGWFTSIQPLLLTAVEDPGELIRGVKSRLRAHPHGGIGFGLLRHLGGEEVRAQLAGPLPQIGFNNLGRIDGALAGEGDAAARFVLAPERPAAGQSPRAPRRHLFEIDAMLLGDRLALDWRYGSGLHERATVLRLAGELERALAEVAAHCLSPDAGGFSPLDFPLAGLDAATLDALAGVGAGLDRSIEDIYPLAPLQEGMLFQGLLDPESGFFLEQLTCTLAGPLDAAAFRRAWQRTVERHAALRTAFAWERLERPLQVVRRDVELPWSSEDLRGAADPAVAARAREAAEKARPFDLARPPLMRALLLRTGDAEHRFVWSFHHLLFDGWCFSLLFRDVFELYQAELTGGVAELPPVRPYRDFIAWVEAQDGSAAESYFRQALAGFAEPTRLPLDRPNESPKIPDGDEAIRDRALVLPPALAADLSELAEGRGLTLSTLVHAAWALLLGRYEGRPSGELDVVFGTVVSGRPAELAGVESMIGLFINTLPARVVAAPATPLAAWLAEIQSGFLALRQHGTAPLAEVQRASEVPLGEPLFQSIVAFESFPVEESLGEGEEALSVGDVTTEDRADYPLSLSAIPSKGAGRSPELMLRIAYDRRLESTTVRRLLAHLELLLGAFVAAPEGALGTLPTLAAAERHQLLGEWNDTALPPSASGSLDCLHELVSAQARRDPAAPALAGDGGEMTYGELDRRANQFANFLRRRGVAPEARVALAVDRSLSMIVAVLGILKAGAAYVPFDPAAPDDRIAHLLADARPALLVASADLASRQSTAAFMPIALPVVVLEAEWERIGEESDAAPAVAVDPAGLAYVIYTSGSTGTPKGVTIEHRAAATYARSVGARFGLGPGDRELQFAALSFDASVEEIFAPLASGATVVLRSGAVEEPGRFLARCAEQRVSVLSLPTAYWHQVAAALEGDDLALPPALRLVVVGGERALPERWTGWARGAGRGLRLVNVYGPTEATIAATFHEHPGTEDPLAGRREVPIGYPLPGVRAHVVDRDLRPVPVGAPGELLLGGVGVARGYLGQPELTAERFVPDPFAAPFSGAGDSNRLYRTGDLVRRLPDGALEFAGRLDTQVKVRGFRVELGEIEAALAAHPELREAAAGTREDASGSHSLVAYVVSRDAASPVAAEALQAFVGARLPAYMVPPQFVFLDALPLTATDKVDRRALARLTPELPRGERAFVAPRNPIEERLAAIWSDLLGVERVGVDDDFFALGGHSLLATQLASRLRRDLGVELPLPRLFELRRLGDLAAEVLAQTLAAAEAAEVDGLMAELDGLSDEDALALLAAEEEGGPA